jgi:glycosyltransferase involved in cell wall biosynthesis
MVGELKMLFVGRIHPIKNLHLLLGILKKVKSSIELNIVAAIEDKDYWSQCEVLIKELPGNIRVNLLGEVPHVEIENLLDSNHLFVLPTSGENFGHAIFEALAAGRPVLISDQTPWKNLSQFKAGWDLDLKKMDRFVDIIERFASMSHEEFNEWCVGAWQYARHYLDQSNNIKRYLEFFG